MSVLSDLHDAGRRTRADAAASAGTDAHQELARIRDELDASLRRMAATGYATVLIDTAEHIVSRLRKDLP